MLLIAGLFSACDQQGSTSPKSASNNDQTQTQPIPRIVSLTPAVTQMLIDMGKREHIVGVSAVDNKSLGLPSCGTFNDPDIELILDLEADVVITESRGSGKGVPALLREAVDRDAFELVVIPYSRSVADVQRALTDPKTGLGQAVGDAEAAERARDLMATRLKLIHAAVESERPPSVLMLIDPSTLGALGPGATHDEMLRLAGGTNAIASLKTSYVKLQYEQLQRTYRPEVILIFEPGGRPIQPDDARLRALEGMSIPAVVQRRIVVIDHPGAMLPSTALPAVVAQMAKAIHPDRADAIDQAYALPARLAPKKPTKNKEKANADPEGDAGADPEAGP